MLGISYGELFLIIGATAALIGPKDLPIIGRTAGRLAGRAIGYVQLARGQFDSVMHQSQAHQVHKELQDTMSQLEAIRHEIRSISFMNPGPLTRKLGNNLDQTLTSGPQEDSEPKKLDEKASTIISSKDCSSPYSVSTDMHSKANAYARLSKSIILNSDSTRSSDVMNELIDESGLFTVLPVSAESAGLLPNHSDEANGSDIVLEAILEADVACNAKEFFSQAQNQIK